MHKYIIYKKRKYCKVNIEFRYFYHSKCKYNRGCNLYDDPTKKTNSK